MATKLKLQGLAQTLTKIVPTVTAGNLTLTLQDSNGNTPSTSNPFYVVINNQVRTLTSALSVTLTSGTNWFNAGSSELATYEIDYFAFLGYNATDGVTLGFARIPYPRTYGEFSTTSTDEKYLAVSSRTSATSTDEYTIIGRFAATLSASYVWSIPTYTSITLIQGNILSTRSLTYSPTLTNLSAITTVKYKIDCGTVDIFFQANAVSITASGLVGITLPLYGSDNYNIPAYCYDGSTQGLTLVSFATAYRAVNVYKSTTLSTWTGSETGVYFVFNNFYQLN